MIDLSVSEVKPGGIDVDTTISFERRRKKVNELNYASLEASKRLVAAGIVLETECVRYKHYFGNSTMRSNNPYEWRLWYKGLLEEDYETIPAHSMAEVWRELPTYCGIVKGAEESIAKIAFDPDPTEGPTMRELASIRRNTNPTDALIDLLIWVTAQNKKLR